MEPMEDDGVWPAPNEGDYLSTSPKGIGYVNYDKRNGIVFKMLNTNPKLGQRNFKCATDGCQVKVKTDYNNKVINVVVPKKKDHMHNNNAKEIKMLEIVHAEMQHGLKVYKSNGLRKVISNITYRCGGDTELLALRLTDPELEARWLKVRWLRARWNNKDNQHWR
jgi:hypothetical protein